MELTPREKKIKDLKSCGWSDDRIAEELNIPIVTKAKPKKQKSEDKETNG